MKIRFAEKEDITAIRNIYAQYIRTPITFEYELPSEEAFAKRIAGLMKEYPCIVCESDKNILGYAYAHKFAERVAYQWNAELSVYLDMNSVSKGLGTKLYRILTEILKLQNITTVYGIVTLPNEKSERLHTSAGFSQICVLRNAGYKNGKWHDVAWFHKEIAPCLINPEEFLPINKISAAKLNEVINEKADGITARPL